MSNKWLYYGICSTWVCERNISTLHQVFGVKSLGFLRFDYDGFSMCGKGKENNFQGLTYQIYRGIWMPKGADKHQWWSLRIMLEVCISLTYWHLIDFIWHLNASIFRKFRILCPTRVLCRRSVENYVRYGHGRTLVLLLSLQESSNIH